MRVHRLRESILLTSLVLAGIAAGDANPAVPAAAQPAIWRYEDAVAADDAERAKAVSAADAARDKTIGAAKATLVTDLRAAQKDALQKDNVDVATAIAVLAKNPGALAQATSGDGPGANAKAGDLSGTWTVYCSYFRDGYAGEGSVRSYEIKGNDVTVREIEGLNKNKSPMSAKIQDGICLFPPTGSVQGETDEYTRFTKIGDRLLVEIWRSAADAKDNPPLRMGITK
jgi:hypothetical protein